MDQQHNHVDSSEIRAGNKMVGTLQEIVQALKLLSERDNTKFMLIAKENVIDAAFRILYSSHFTEYQRQQIESILRSTEYANIAVIKPTLEQVYRLKLYRDDDYLLIQHYTDLFTSLSQAVCKDVAKMWIKVAEPKKQALFPYKNFNLSKPTWWPENVNHIEPDHLDKEGRIAVLICLLRRREFLLEEMKLKTSVLDVKNPYAHRILDEIYYVAFFDRIFYDTNRKSNPFYQLLRKEDKEILDGNRISLVVSNFKGANLRSRKCGVVMLSQLSPSTISTAIFDLNGKLACFGDQKELSASAREKTYNPESLQTKRFSEFTLPVQKKAKSYNCPSEYEWSNTDSPKIKVEERFASGEEETTVKIEDLSSLFYMDSSQLCLSATSSSLSSNNYEDAHYHFQRRVINPAIAAAQVRHELQRSSPYQKNCGCNPENTPQELMFCIGECSADPFSDVLR